MEAGAWSHSTGLAWKYVPTNFQCAQTWKLGPPEKWAGIPSAVMSRVMYGGVGAPVGGHVDLIAPASYQWCTSAVTRSLSVEPAPASSHPHHAFLLVC